MDDEPRLAIVDALVLLRPALAIAMLEKHAVARHFEHLGRRAGHQIEPIGVLRRRAVVRPRELGDVQRIFVAIDDQRHVGHVALVQPIARDAALRRPAAKVPRPVPQSIRKLLGLPRRILLQSAKRRAHIWFRPGRRLRLRHFRWQHRVAVVAVIGCVHNDRYLVHRVRGSVSPGRGGRGP